MSHYVSTYEEKIEELKTVFTTAYTSYALYTKYLPRLHTLSILNAHPDWIDYYQYSKQALNSLSKYNINPWISESDNLNWFVYDDESLNFWTAMEKIKINVKSKIKFLKIGKRTQLFFEDKYETITWSAWDFDKFFINWTYSFTVQNQEDIDKKLLNYDSRSTMLVNGSNVNTKTMTKKFKMDIMTTGRDLLMWMNKKLSWMNTSLCFDPTVQILKVKSLNDYIFDLDTPLSKFAYINECVTRNIDAEYIIIPNPFMMKETENGEIIQEDNEEKINKIFRAEHSYRHDSGIFDKSLSSGDNELLNIALFKPESMYSNSLKDKDGIDKYNNRMINKGNTEDKLSNFVHDIICDWQANIRNTINEINSQINVSDDNSTINTTISSIKREENKEKETHTITYEQTLSNWNPLEEDASIENDNSNINQTELDIIISKTSFNPSTPNIFTQGNKLNSDVYSMLKLYNEEINSLDIDRPFSIIIRDLYLNQFYDSFPVPILNNIFHSVILLKVQIYCGSWKFSKPMQIRWITFDQDLHAEFNKRIYFDINYSSLPTFASLIFKLKHVIYNKDKEITSKKTIGWTNHKLFDHKKTLITGLTKITFHTNKFSDDSYFCYKDSNITENTCSIYFELDTFPKAVMNKEIKIENYKSNLDWDSFIISINDQEKIDAIMKKTPFDTLYYYDKEVLWNNRYKLSQEPSILPKLLMCINYKNKSHWIELEKIWWIAKPLTPVQSMELLTGKYLHESIRKFAVKCLSGWSMFEMQLFLLQLVQGLKYEMYHYNDLAKYWLTMAINHPLTIGHCLFWCLRSEMYNTHVQQRFGLYWQIFLNKIGPKLVRIFSDEAMWMKRFYEIAKIPLQRPKKGEQKNTAATNLLILKSELKKLNVEFENNFMEISLPLNFKLRIKGIKTEKCRSMQSKKKPWWLFLQNADPKGDDIVILYKCGDDLRMDIVTLQLFKIMQKLWFEEQLNLKMSIYNVVSTGYYQGWLEIVTNSETLADIHVKEGGALESFKKSSLKKWLELNAICSEEEYTNNFMLSNIAYCLATFVWGIGDRHSDNIMVKKNGELFHIDFGHFWGHFKYKMGIKRERAPFVFTEQFQNVWGGNEGEKFKEFKVKFLTGYSILRKNAPAWITLLKTLLCTGIPELTEDSIKYLEKSLALNSNCEEAEEFLEGKLIQSINSWSVKLNFWIHIIANNIKK